MAYENMTPYAAKICSDCLFFFANGDLPTGGETRRGGIRGWTQRPDMDDPGEDQGYVDYQAALAHNLENCDLSLGVVAGACDYCNCEDDNDLPYECEPSFSWGRCEACQSTYGGDRHHATIWVPNETNETNETKVETTT